MSSLKILSVNCQGLRNTSKIKDAFDMLKSKNCYISCFQDTHFTNDVENIVRSMWGSECYFSSVSSNSRGVASLVNNNFECIVLKESKKYTWIFFNFKYSCRKQKDTDNPDFFSNVMSVIDDLENEYFVICCDFNLVQNPCINYRIYVNMNNPKSIENLLEFI